MRPDVVRALRLFRFHGWKWNLSAITLQCLLSALLLALWPPRIMAAAPANSVCSGAEVIPGDAGAAGPYWTAVTDISAAADAGNPIPDCQTYVTNGVWYIFTPATNAVYTFSTCGPSTTVEDTVMAIFTSQTNCNGPFGQVDCNDDFCGLHSLIARGLTNNTTYYILVYRYSDDGSPLPPGSTNVDVQIKITRTILPPNDTCASAQPVMLNIPVVGSTAGAVDNYRLDASPACFPGIGNTPTTAPGLDVVYLFSAPADGLYSFKVINFSDNNDFVIYLATNCPAGNSPATLTSCLAAAKRNNFNYEEVMCVFLSAQQTVYVFVDESSLTSGGAFRLEVTACVREAESNNSPTNATPFVCGIEGSISPGNDVDFYSLGTFSTGSRAFALVDGNAANTTRDFDLRITTATDTLEFDDQDNDSPFGQFSPNIAGTPLPHEPVFLRVNYRAAAAAAEPYRVFAVVQPPYLQADVESEPNDTLAQASFSPKNYFRGALSGPAPSTDIDYYRFKAAAGDLIFLSLDNNPHRTDTPVGAKLELLDSAGNLLLGVSDPSQLTGPRSSTNVEPGSLTAETPFSPGQALVYRLSAGGSFYARVSLSDPANQGPSGAGDYLLSISKGCQGVAISNNPPAIRNLAATTLVAEGGFATLSGLVLDPDLLDTHIVVVDWGDSSVTTNFFASGVTNFAVSHQYLLPTPSGAAYPVALTLFDEAGCSAFATTNIVVQNVPPRFSNVAITSPLWPLDTATLTGNIIDPGLLDAFQLVVNWGDGTAAQTNAYPAGSNSFNLTHLYQLANTNVTVDLRLSDANGGSDMTNVAAIIQPPPGGLHFQSTFLAADGSLVMQVQGGPGATYRLLFSTDLINWNVLVGGTLTVGTNGFGEIQIPAPPSGLNYFYRAVWP